MAVMFLFVWDFETWMRLHNTFLYDTLTRYHYYYYRRRGGGGVDVVLRARSVYISQTADYRPADG